MCVIRSLLTPGARGTCGLMAGPTEVNAVTISGVGFTPAVKRAVEEVVSSSVRVVDVVTQ